MAEKLEQFDDTNLKSAVRRAVGAAPDRPDLRARIAELVQKEAAAASGNGAVAGTARIYMYQRRQRRPMAWLAAAAVLLLAVGSSWFLYQRHHEAEEQREYLAANNMLLKDMLKAQQGAGEVKPVGVALADREAVPKALSQALGRDVLVPQWAGWELNSAGVGTIGGFQAARLVYKNGGQQVLFVSLPAKAFNGGDEDDKYEYVVGGHPLAGFIKGDSLNCVVGDQTVKLQTASEMAKSLAKG